MTATASDSIIGLDRDLTRVFEWWAGSEPELARYMNEHPRQATMWDHDFRSKGGYWNRFHINHVFFDGNGDMIVNLPNIEMGAGVTKFWNVTQRRFHLVGSAELNPIDGRIHDGIILDGYHYLGRTEDGSFIKLCKRKRKAGAKRGLPGCARRDHGQSDRDQARLAARCRPPATTRCSWSANRD